ncbi:TolB family protein [Gemmata sp.]|uniref:TolB family protein n=1 Tax=Gemmata sp. TaxID=1914242 RepID=UPI003F70418B
MAQIAIAVTDPAGNRAAVTLDNYTQVRTALSACVKQLGLPTQLNYHLFPAGTRAKLAVEKTLVAAGVRPGSELALAPVRDVVFATVTERLYAEARDLARREDWDAAGERFGQLLRVFPDHPDPDGLRGSVPVSDAAPAAPPAVTPAPVQRPAPVPQTPPVGTAEPRRQPAASKGGGCFGAVLAIVCLPLWGLGVRCAEPAPLRLTTDGSFKQHLQWSPDGKTLLLTRIHQGKMALWTLPAAGGEMTRLLPEHKEPHFDGHFSPDGKRIVYVYDNLQGTDGKLRINVCNADGSDDKTLVPHAAMEESPRWSPDGKQVLWVSTRGKNPDLYVVDADGKNEKRLTSDPAPDLHPAWSPDGKRIAFSSGRSGRQKVHVMAADGGDVKKLTGGEFLDAWPAWRPGGKQIAFTSNRSGDADVWLMIADGTGLVNLTGNPAQDTGPAWSPDGTRLAFVSTRDGGSDVYVTGVK